jgi:DNA-binding HxlR family transcriptional regulator
MQLQKLTKSRQGQEKRRYDDACGTAHGLELIGERWALLVLRELLLGPRRFSDLKADLPGISANVLTQRLAELEERGLIRRTKLPPPASVQVYEATEWGLEAEPIIQTLGRWAARSPAHNSNLPISGTSIMLSLRTMIDEKKAKGLEARIGFRFENEAFLGRLRKGGIRIRRAEPAEADLVFTGTPTQLAAVIYGGAPLETIGVEGDIGLARRFVTLFPLPPKAAQGPN